DADPPTLSRLVVASQVGADVVGWKSSSPDDVATVGRAARGGRTTVVFRGGGATFTDKEIQPGLEYRYSVQTEDQARNASHRLSALALPKVVDRKSTRLNSSHQIISYAVFCLKKKKKNISTKTYECLTYYVR